jgi:hypothetical protein
MSSTRFNDKRRLFMRGLRWIGALVALGSSFVAYGAVGSLPISPKDVLENPSILEDGEPVDIVYTWVDGSSSSWKKQRKYWVGKIEGLNNASTRKARFRSHDELKYSLRSIEAFAPFVRNIYIVTSGQRPKWLADHPKIHLITHKEIFSKKEHLPTFNSIAIETNLHHIEGLANRYIYLNDDVFLGKPATRSDFFIKGHKIKVFSSGKKIFGESKHKKPRAWEIPSQNMANYMMKELATDEKPPVREMFFYHSHTPFPMFKRIAQAAERRFHNAFREVASHKFRTDKDVTITNGLIPHYAVHLEEAEVVAPDAVTFSFKAEPKEDRKGLKALLKKRPMFFCIQDTAGKTNKAAEKCLKKFFEAYFPNKAPWEKEVTKKRKK